MAAFGKTDGDIQKLAEKYREKVTYKGKPIPNGGWAKEGTYVWRGDRSFLNKVRDDRERAKLFEEGIRAKVEPSDTNLDARTHTKDTHAGQAFVSTSTKRKTAERFSGDPKIVATIRVGKTTIAVDINKTAKLLGEKPEFSDENEVAFLVGIPGDQIIRFELVAPNGDILETFDNPN